MNMKVLSLGFVVLLSIGLSSCLDSGNNFDPNAQLKIDTTAIRKYLTDNNINATKTPYGVWYKILNPGTGFYPTYSDTIVVNYTGYLLSDGSQFETQSAFSFKLTEVIGGWQIALPRFPVGTTGRIYIPSGYAYGSTPTSKIPANSNLIFNVTVVSTSGFQLKKDTTTIGKFISNNAITGVIKDPSGIRYTIDTPGAGPTAIPSGHVTITYAEKPLVLNGTNYNSVTTPTRFYLPGMLNAFGIILPKINEGSSVTLYVPSGLAYSIFQSGSILPNTNLIYKITLTKVEP
jgi:FKBP-type peptidyl-prolyl cis-trans isomerase FkpA